MEVFMKYSYLLVLVAAVCLAGVGFAAGGAPAATAPAASAAAANELTVTGKLSTGVMAIGAETTGTVINDGKTSYELDIKDAAMKKTAEGLNGKQVTVKGTLTIKQGIEVG